MKKNAKHTVLLGFVVCILLCAGIVYLFFGDSIRNNGYTQEPYSLFYAQVQAKEIKTVTVNGDRLLYTKEGADSTFCTQNPHSPLLTEFLLQNDVHVILKQDGVQLFSTLMDILFYIIFFGVIVVVFRRFISPHTFKVVRHTGKTFADVIGMDDLKRSMLQITDIMAHPKEYAQNGIRMPKGILLEGAPGNGKTLFARALAGEAHIPFIPAKATDFESMFMAIGPLKVKLLFQKARRRAPCIVFIDEFDGIGTRRNYSGSAIETENTRIVTALLNELDGFEPTKGVLVLAATNSISALDEALIRPGRFDAHISVPYPDFSARVQIIELYSKGKEFEPDCTPHALAELFKGYSCAKIESVLNTAMLKARQDGRTKIARTDLQKSGC